MNIVKSQIIISEEELQAFNDAAFDVSNDVFKIEGKKHNLYGHAFTDGNFLIFFDNEDMASMQKFIYYMGGEHDAELVTRYAGVSIWGGMNEGRLMRGIEEDDKGEDIVYEIVTPDDEDDDEDFGEEEVAGC